MKRSVFGVLVLVLILSLSVSGFTAEPEMTETHLCDHVWNEDTPTISWASVTEAQCERKCIHRSECEKCGKVSSNEKTERFYHEDGIVTATCNGTLQTVKYTCEYCGVYRYTRWLKCPGARRNHFGGCHWLAA